MSDNKKYYYLKFKDNFFDQDHIKVVEAQENGYIFSNILLKMYLRSLKFDGKLMITEKIPYDKEKPEILAKVLGHDISHLKECIRLASELGIIKILNTGEIYMLDIQNFIGHSTTEADRIRDYRHRIKENETKDVTNVQQMNDKSTPERELDIEKDKEAIKKESVSKEAIEQVVKEYPTKCNKRGSTTRRSTYDENKLKKKIREIGIDNCIEIIKLYIADCTKTNTYIMNFKTFVNNFPAKEDYKDIASGGIDWNNINY